MISLDLNTKRSILQSKIELIIIKINLQKNHQTSSVALFIRFHFIVTIVLPSISIVLFFIQRDFLAGSVAQDTKAVFKVDKNITAIHIANVTVTGIKTNQIIFENLKDVKALFLEDSFHQKTWSKNINGENATYIHIQNNLTIQIIINKIIGTIKRTNVTRYIIVENATTLTQFFLTFTIFLFIQIDLSIFKIDAQIKNNGQEILFICLKKSDGDFSTYLSLSVLPAQENISHIFLSFNIFGLYFISIFLQ